MWTYERQSDGSGKWSQTLSDATGEDVKSAVAANQAEAEIAKTNSQNAVDKADSAIQQAVSAYTLGSNANQLASDAKNDAATALTKIGQTDNNLTNVQTQLTDAKSDLSAVTQKAKENGDSIIVVQSDISGFKNQLADTDGRVSSTEQDINGLKTAVTDSKNDITVLQTTATGLTANMQDAQGNIASLQATAQNIMQTVSDTNTRIGNLRYANNNLLTGTHSDWQSYTFYNGDWGTGDAYFSEDLEPNTIYTFQTELKANDSTTTYHVEIHKYTPDGGDYIVGNNMLVNSGISYTTFTTDGAGTYTKYGFLPHVIGPNPGGTQNTIQWRHEKLERGSTITDWSPAPQDFTDLSTIVTGHTTQIEQNAASINLKANSTDVDQLAGRVSTAEGNISVMAGQIQTKVTQNDINNSLAGYATQDWTNGQITVKANEINSSVARVQTNLDNLQIGGTNLLAGTSSDWTTVSTTGWNANLPNWWFNTAVTEDTTYTLRAYLKPGSHSGAVQLNYNYSSGETAFNTGTHVASGQEGYSYVTVTVPKGTTFSNCTIISPDNPSDSYDYSYKEAKLEISTKPSSWSPAPQDMATNVALSEVKQTADGLLTTVSSLQSSKADISYVDQTATMISGKVGYDNLVANPEFTGAGDHYIPGWDINANEAYVGTSTYDVIEGSKVYALSVLQDDSNKWFQGALSTKFVPAPAGQAMSFGAYILKWDGDDGNDLSVQYEFFAADQSTRTGFGVIGTAIKNQWVACKLENVIPPDNTVYVRMTAFAHGTNKFSTGHWQMSRSTTLPYYSTAGTGSFSILNDNINLRVEKNGVINAVNISSEGIQIYGDKLHITASTYIDNAVIKSAMIDTLSADKITVGTLNGANVNVINLNAANITTGTLSGSNLSLNLDTGEVLFQKGAIKSTDGLLDIEINDGTFSQNNSSGDGFIFRNGNIYFSNKSSWAAWDAPLYGTISLNERAFAAGQGGMAIKGAKNVVVQTDDYNGDFVMGPPSSLTGSGLLLREDRIEMASAQTYLYGGLGYSYINHPFIEIGTSIWENQYNDNAGSNVLIRASGIILDGNVMSLNGFHISNNYITTAGDGLWVNSAFGSGGNATIHAQSFSQTSLLSKKTNVIPLDRLKARNAIRTVDIQEYMYKDDVENGITKKYSSGIIDDINEKPKYSMPFDWISADGKGREDGTALGYTIVAVQDLYDQIEDLKEQVKQLKGESAA
ncbi:gp58-like family protein [Liquorilactobacillus satsumensis]